MIGKLRDLTFGANGEQHITVTVRADFRERFDELKDAEVEVEIKKRRKKRSLNANAYFHVLASKIAEHQGIGNEEAKRALVREYGALAKDKDGLTIGFKLPVSVDVNAIYPYVKCFDTREEDGKLFDCYLVYKQTHLMDSAEMARLIDGAVYAARDLGIETDTPDQIARYKAEWGCSRCRPMIGQ
jgi:hypothetical protein